VTSFVPRHLLKPFWHRINKLIHQRYFDAFSCHDDQPTGEHESQTVFKILISMDNKASLVGTTFVPSVATSFRPLSRLAFDHLVHRPLFFVRMERTREIYHAIINLLFF
jgi:hypothetical protein